MESASLTVICVKECYNDDYIKEFGLNFKSFKFTPGVRYSYHNCVKKKFNFIYDMNWEYYGCVTKEFINKNFVTLSDYEKEFNEVDSLFEKELYEKR